MFSGHISNTGFTTSDGTPYPAPGVTGEGVLVPWVRGTWLTVLPYPGSGVVWGIYKPSTDGVVDASDSSNIIQEFTKKSSSKDIVPVAVLLSSVSSPLQFPENFFFLFLRKS